MFPFGYQVGFNPLIVGGLNKIPFVIGPIQLPQEYTDITDFILSTGKRGFKAEVSHRLTQTILSSVKPILKKINIKTIKCANALIFDSKRTADLYKNTYGDILSNKIICITTPGIESDLFKESKPLHKQDYELITVGHLSYRKGIQYLIKAMPIVIEEYRNVKLIIVGGGPYRRELESLASKLKLNKNIIFKGNVPRKYLLEYYAYSDIYIHPSLSESFPSAIREAMSVGRPVISTDVGFADEHIKNGINGFLVKPKEVQSLASAILLLLNDEKLRLKIGKNNRKYAEKYFDYNIMAKKIYKIYEEVAV